MAKLSSTHIYGDLYVDGSIDGKVSKDSAGQQINTTYIKGLSVSGKTITYTKGDGTTGTITTQDTNTTYSAATQSAAGLMSAADKKKLDGVATSANNYSHPNSGVSASSYGPSANASPAHSGTFSVPYITVNAAGHITAASTKTITLPADNNTWRGVQNNLTSDATDQSLSAAQGKVLKGLVDGKAASSHTHNYAGSSSAGGAATTALACTGNSATATKLATTRAIKIGNKSLNFDGSAAITYTLSDIGAAAASHGTHLTIGTGAGNAAAGNHTHSGYASSSHSHDFFYVKGNNTINSTSNDKTTNWGDHGNSVHFYTATGQLIDQPSQWGYILNIGKTGGEVHQIWMTQASGDMFHRGGNASGWSGSWRKLLDSSNWSSYAAPTSHNHSQLTGEVKFPGSGSYTDPWSGTGCCIKGTGNIGITGSLRANSGIATCGASNGTATSDGATYVANLRYASSRGILDLGSNTIPGRIYVRSGQGTAGSGVYIENRVTNGNAYMQYLSPEAGTIALTSHLSDRTKKENIVYVGSEDSDFTNKDFYDFIRDDLGLATYNYKKEYATTDIHTKLNFIAQDILYDIENGCENKVGNLIVQTENAMETQGNLRYDPEIYTSVIAGALKESINKIEELESEKVKMQAEIDELKADLTELKAIVKGLL